MDELTLPTLDVVLCVNKSNPWLKDAISSILDQDDRDFRFLIAANNCSDDLWSELILLTANDHRVRLFRSKIGQLSYNLNFLADCSEAEYLVRMDADDVSLSNRVRILRSALAEQPVDVLGSAVQLINAENQVVGEMSFPLDVHAIYRSLPVRTVFCHPSVALRREFLLGIRGYLGGFVSEDTDLWIRARRAGAHVRNLPDYLLKYRVHSDQSIGSRIGYAEVASYWLREFILAPSFYNARGLLVALVKVVVSKALPGIWRYKSAERE